MKKRWRPASTGTPSDVLVRFLDRGLRDREHQRKVEKAVREAGAAAPPANNRKLPGDPAALRGIPAIGHGVGGTMSGTNPEHDNGLAVEQRRQERRRR